jgi:chemotaxis protein CheY-P-specific phosphatase CheC
MTELHFDEMSLVRAVQNIVAYGAADQLGSVIGTALFQSPPSRDQLAAMAMQGMLASPRYSLITRALAETAYEMADAMISVRNKS